MNIGFADNLVLGVQIEDTGWLGLFFLVIWILNQVASVFGKNEQKTGEGDNKSTGEQEARRAEVRRRREEASRMEMEKLRQRKEEARAQTLRDARPAAPRPPVAQPARRPSATPAQPQRVKQTARPTPAPVIPVPAAPPAVPVFSAVIAQKKAAENKGGLLNFDDRVRNTRLERLQRVLQNRGQVQTALVLGEILNTPVALRDRDI